MISGDIVIILCAIAIIGLLQLTILGELSRIEDSLSDMKEERLSEEIE